MFNHVVSVIIICVVMSHLEIDNSEIRETVFGFRGIFNVSLSRAHYNTNFPDRDEMVKPVVPK